MLRTTHCQGSLVASAIFQLCDVEEVSLTEKHLKGCHFECPVLERKKKTCRNCILPEGSSRLTTFRDRSLRKKLWLDEVMRFGI